MNFASVPRRTALILVLFGISIALAACGSSGTPATQSAPKSLAIRGYKFQPAVLTLRKGDTAVWTNEDTDKHTVTADAGSGLSLDSTALPQHGTYRFTASKTGVFHYHCNFHPFMQGTVKVVAAG